MAYVQTEGQFPTKYKFKDLNEKNMQGRAPLDPFHTHFLLVDNGTDGKSGVEINMRVNLEQYIVKKCNYFSIRITWPLVL